MYKLILAAVAALLLAACAASSPSKTVHLQGAPAASDFTVVATLATNACEAETAADYTAVIVARRTAARLLRGGEIPVATAEAVQRLADQARRSLDNACPAGKPDAKAIASARADRAQIVKLLEQHHAH